MPYTERVSSRGIEGKMEGTWVRFRNGVVTCFGASPRRKLVCLIAILCLTVLAVQFLLSPEFLTELPAVHEIIGTYSYGPAPVTRIGNGYYVYGNGSLTIHPGGRVECTDGEVAIRWGTDPEVVHVVATIIPASSRGGTWELQKYPGEEAILQIIFKTQDGKFVGTAYMMQRTPAGIALWPAGVPDEVWSLEGLYQRRGNER